MPLDPCQRHLVPGVWTLQGLLHLPSSSHVTHRDLSSVTHAGRTLASLAFYVSGAASTAEDGLTSLYDTVSVCSVSPSSPAALMLCHPDLQRCHLTHWSTLSPDPKSEFPPQ